MAQIDINTSQNVNLNFTIASIGERFFAFLIDNLIKIIVVYLLNLIFIEILNLEQYAANWDMFSIKGLKAILMLPYLFYTLTFESLMEGQTPGKKLLKIKVVKMDGYQAGFSDYLIRWVFRLVDFGLFFLPCLISIMISKTNSRLGDIASGTAVISLKNKVNLSQTILEKIDKDYRPMFPQVISLTDNDVRIIKDNFLKAKASNDQKVILRLTQKILETLQLNADDIPLTKNKFIETIIKDYNYYTSKET